MTPANQVIKKIMSEEFGSRMPALKSLMSDTIKEEVPKLIKEQVGLLPTRDEFFTKMDEVMGELKSMREEFALTVPKISGYEERISALEEIHPDSKHASI